MTAREWKCLSETESQSDINKYIYTYIETVIFLKDTERERFSHKHITSERESAIERGDEAFKHREGQRDENV